MVFSGFSSWLSLITSPSEAPLGCPAFAPESGPIFGCSTYSDCSPKYTEPAWFAKQAQYVSDDFSRMMIVKAAELSRFAYKFRDQPQNEVVYRSKSTTELIDTRLMYSTRQLYEGDTPIHPPDKSLEKFYADIYGEQSGFVLDSVFDYEDSSIGYVGVLRMKTSIVGVFRYMGVVAFRGTWNIQDVGDSMGYVKNTHDAHSSYYARVVKRAPWIFTQLSSLQQKYGFDDVLFTGHSMGGTEASMAPVILDQHLQFKPKLNFHVITFAQTRPGGKVFSNLAKESTTFHRRVENCADPATVLPVTSMGHQHIDDALLIYPEGSGFELVPYQIDQKHGGLGIGFFNIICTIRSGMQAFFFQQTYVHQLNDVYLGRLLKIWPECVEHPPNITLATNTQYDNPYKPI